ncbi:response regulator [Patescibacteria group bacterium]|nr:response regulator [Patescibacteria group bacterium]
MELEGCVVDWMSDGREGLEQALKATYDCVILDIMLPELDGVSLLNELRTQKKTPVIMTTAKGQLDDKFQSYEA